MLPFQVFDVHVVPKSVSINIKIKNLNEKISESGKVSVSKEALTRCFSKIRSNCSFAGKMYCL